MTLTREDLTEDYVITTCKLGQRRLCCRYLTRSVQGWDCEKNSSFKPYLDSRVLNNSIVSQGDNCEGILK